MNYSSDPFGFYSNTLASQQMPYQPPQAAKQEFSYTEFSTTPSLDQSWFGTNFTMSPYDLTSQLLPSTYASSQQHYLAQPQFHQQTPLAYHHDSSSSSGGSTFSSPQSHPAPSPPRFAGDSYFPQLVSTSTDSSAGIRLESLDGELGYHQEEREPCGFTGFFSGNVGVKQEEQDEDLLEPAPRVVGYREGSIAASDDSFVSPPPTPPISSFAPTPVYASTSTSSKRSRSPENAPARSTRPRRVDSTSTSSASRKRVKASPSSPTISALNSVYDEAGTSLPPLPRDFGQYGEGGSMLYDDSPNSSSSISRNGRATTPDFTGRDDYWGVGKDAYDKLSAKAKKQLRNKIGARRFRERRKEYICTLEAKLNERDEIIGDFRGRLVSSLSQVAALQARLAELESQQ